MKGPERTRREFLLQAAAAASVLAARPALAATQVEPELPPLAEFGYDQVRIGDPLLLAQRDNARTVLMGLDLDSLLKPFRAMGGLAAPGASLGGWYEWKPDYNHHHDDAGLAPGSTLGQWTSALSRMYACSKFGGSAGDEALAERVRAVHAGIGSCIRTSYFQQTRFAAYTLDKLVCGLTDAHTLAGDAHAFETMGKVVDAAEPAIPSHAVDREIQWKPGADVSWVWDESYTLPENLYRAGDAGAGPRYRRLAERYLLNGTFFEPLANGVNLLADKHAYSHVNALCSAAQAYLSTGSRMHLRAAQNGFAFLRQQSFATGGWGPEETLRAPGYDELAKSLSTTHNSFETPCGGFAHLKLTRALLRATGDARYGDSMERVIHNALRGALPLMVDGRSFYSADYGYEGRRTYSVHRWPCCSGTLPQVSADYGISSYLRRPGQVWVNLYGPSEVRWNEDGVAVSLVQDGSYLADGKVRLRVDPRRPVSFSVWLRIPDWAGADAVLRVNGKAQTQPLIPGFTAVTRRFRTGDTIELDLPMRLRVEALPTDGAHSHADTVVLMRGPLVLFPLREVGDVGPLVFKAENLLKAEQSGEMEWVAKSAAGMRKFVPFDAVGDRSYSTYVKLG